LTDSSSGAAIRWINGATRRPQRPASRGAMRRTGRVQARDTGDHAGDRVPRPGSPKQVPSTNFKARTKTYSSRSRLNQLLCPQDDPNSFPKKQIAQPRDDQREI
jgi:hypothetical protein